MIGKTLVIGFGHKARQGKDSAARLIHEFDPRATKVYSFAAALRALCRVEYGMTEKDARLLQDVGLRMRETRGPDVWVNAVRWLIDEEQPEVALVTDVRFPNEVEFCDAAVKVTRLVPIAQSGWGTPTVGAYVAGDRPADHPSETALDGFTGWYDEITVLDGQMDTLRERAIGTYRNVLLDARSGRFDTQEAA